MKFLLFLFGAFLAAGLFFFAAEAVKLPRLTYERAMRSAVGGGSRFPSFDALCLEWAGKLAKHIRLDQYRRRRMLTLGSLFNSIGCFLLSAVQSDIVLS